MQKAKLLLLGSCLMFGMAAGAQEKTPAEVYFDKGKLHLRSKDDNFHLWFDNRINIESAVYSPTESVDGLTSKTNKDLEEDDGQFRFSNGTIIRRARFGIKATLYEKWFAELDVDFANNEVEIKEMFMGYRFSDHWNVKMGNFKVPMSMERVTSSKYLMSAERPMPVEAFADGRRLGIAGTGWGKGWWASAGAFGRSVDILQKERNRGNDGWALAARAALSPVNNDDMTIHIGGYANYQTPSHEGTEDFNQPPINNTPMITGLCCINSIVPFLLKAFFTIFVAFEINNTIFICCF